MRTKSAKPQDPIFREDDDLPEGWVSAPLASLISIESGKYISRSEYVQDKSKPYPVAGAGGPIGWSSNYNYLPPMMTIGRVGAVGRVSQYQTRAWVTDNALVITPRQPIFRDFLALFFETVKWCDIQTGSTQPLITQGILREILLPLPPLPEQRRIVGQVEALLARVNNARARLARAPTLLKAFRQSVLSAACSGKLTEDWRESKGSTLSANQLLQAMLRKREALVRTTARGKYKEPSAPTDSGELDIPDTWTLATLDQASCLVTSGSRGWAQYYADRGPLFLRAQDISHDYLETDGIAHVELPPRTEGTRTKVLKGDLLITITGANVTKAAPVIQDFGEAYVSQHVALIRLVEPALRSFLFLWIISPSHGRAKLLDDAYGAGKPGLNLDNIRELVIALPAVEEQHEIVRRVDAFFALADSIEVKVAAAQKRADALTQAILAKAFRGELVPTEAARARAEGRSFESAAELLSRIQTDQGAQRPAIRIRARQSRRGK